jgi:hypothetical protein
MGSAPIDRQLRGKTPGGFFFCFPWSYGLSSTSGNSEVISSDFWLVSSIWFLCPQVKLQLGSELKHYQLVHGGPICCFCHIIAALPYSCNYVWSAPPPARWGNSVLSTAPYPETSPHFGRLTCHPTLLKAFFVMPLLT